MLVAKRVYAAALAALLAASLGAGSLALATEGGSILQEIAEAGGSSADPGSGTADLGLADLGSFATVVQGPVTYQVLDGWHAEDLSDDGVSCYYFEDLAGMFECIVSPESLIGSESEFTAEYLAYIFDQTGGCTFEDPVDRYLDGALVRDVSFSTEQRGVSFRGVVTLMFGSDCTVVAESVFTYDESYDPSSSYVQVHRSLGWAAAAPSWGGDAEGSVPFAANGDARTGADLL